LDNFFQISSFFIPQNKIDALVRTRRQLDTDSYWQANPTRPSRKLDRAKQETQRRWQQEPDALTQEAQRAKQETQQRLAANPTAPNRKLNAQKETAASSRTRSFVGRLPRTIRAVKLRK
jgi:hypothetical protein